MSLKTEKQIEEEKSAQDGGALTSRILNKISTIVDNKDDIVADPISKGQKGEQTHASAVKDKITNARDKRGGKMKLYNPYAPQQGKSFSALFHLDKEIQLELNDGYIELDPKDATDYELIQTLLNYGFIDYGRPIDPKAKSVKAVRQGELAELAKKYTFAHPDNERDHKVAGNVAFYVGDQEKSYQLEDGTITVETYAEAKVLMDSNFILVKQEI